MTTDVTTLLRSTLTDDAAALPASTDPWARFERLERRHRRARRTRRAGGTLAVVAVLGLTGTGVVPVPSWTPAVTVSAATSPLLDGPVTGSLAGDRAWLDAFRDAVPALTRDEWSGDSDGHWRVGGPDDVRVVFAGDVDGRRLVLADLALRIGYLRAHTGVWFEGEAGAAPSDLAVSTTGELPDAPLTARYSGTGGVVRLLAVAPSASAVEASGGTVPRPDGTVSRTWTPLVRGDDGAWTGVVQGSAATPLLRWTVGGRTRTAQADAGSADGVGGADAWPTAVPESLGGSGPTASLLSGAVAAELAPTGLLPASTSVVPLWRGTVDGDDAVLALARQSDGGAVVVAVTGRVESDSMSSSRTHLLLVVPVAGAPERPYAFRTRVDGGDGASGRVEVVVPPGATAARLESPDGTTVDVPLVDRHGTATLAADANAWVVALDESGREVGRTPVPPLSETGLQAPGESPATSLDLAEKALRQ